MAQIVRIVRLAEVGNTERWRSGLKGTRLPPPPGGEGEWGFWTLLGDRVFSLDPDFTGARGRGPRDKTPSLGPGRSLVLVLVLIQRR